MQDYSTRTEVRQAPLGGSPHSSTSIEEVNRALNEVALFTIFNTANPSQPNTPVPLPGDPTQLIGMNVNEDLHRMEILVKASPNGFRVDDRVGEQVAGIHINWRVIPDDFVAYPDVWPPPTVLNPSQSQRFCMLGGQMTFLDPAQTILHAFGTGRTFPVMVGNKPQLQLGAVVDILETTQSFSGMTGVIVVNGYITPPYALDLSILIRLVDVEGRLRPTSEIPPLRQIPDPDPESVFILLKGEPDPAYPTRLNYGPNGPTGTDLHEILRLVDVNFDIASGIETRHSAGPVVGRLTGVTHIDLASGANPAPLTTSNGVFTFCDRDGEVFGTLHADIVEGRAFPTQVEGLQFPMIRVGGFGPLIRGTGQFANATGMLSVNSAISVDPQALSYSMLYLLRIADPDGRFRGAVEQRW